MLEGPYTASLCCQSLCCRKLRRRTPACLLPAAGWCPGAADAVVRCFLARGCQGVVCIRSISLELSCALCWLLRWYTSGSYRRLASSLGAAPPPVNRQGGNMSAQELLAVSQGMPRRQEDSPSWSICCQRAASVNMHALGRTLEAYLGRAQAAGEGIPSV